MRIAIIAIFGILSFLLVFLPGYFLLVPGDEEVPVTVETSADVPEPEEAETTEKLPLTNPGDAPPLK